ncbi:hypothetical protein JT689_10815 [Halobacterium sp. GSL-19]|uniref:hypothetical protein n=1 Tax=Halobacterium sp. GSL-19 TaxID=2812551 RepID=UPI001965EB64|nr:hypothetical protein [Halobacterium sp. GSL-19]QRY22491.1 hypothetical protein JT689_10815 [Halobacterium sp. GSL-19]
MTENKINPGEINRRELLKKVGGAAATTAAISGSASASNTKSNGSLEDDEGSGGTQLDGNVVEEKELDTESERVEKLLDKPAIQTVAETVETPNDETVDNLDPIAVTEYLINLGDSLATAFEIETEIGDLLYVDGADDVKYKIENSEVIKKKVPKVWDEFKDTTQGLPSGTSVTILANDSTTEIVRSISDTEVEKIKDAINYTGNQFNASYSIDLEGFYVRVVDGETVRRLKVAADDEKISSETVEFIITPQDNDCGCLPCIEAVASKAGCYIGCFSAGGVTGGAACIICISLSSFSLRNCDGCNPPCCLNCCNFSCAPSL